MDNQEINKDVENEVSSFLNQAWLVMSIRQSCRNTKRFVPRKL